MQAEFLLVLQFLLDLSFLQKMLVAAAVTSVKEGTSNQKCDICHTVNKIDFTFPPQGNPGNTVLVAICDNAQSDYLVSSALATAIAAGITILAWSKIRLGGLPKY